MFYKTGCFWNIEAPCSEDRATNIRLGCKMNGLLYYNLKLLTSVKSFIAQAAGSQKKFESVAQAEMGV